MDTAPTTITTHQALAELIDELSSKHLYALDTEFHRERTYFPKLALIQIAWDDGLVLVDPLAVDVSVLSELFDTPATAIIHAADQDLEVLAHACGSIPRHMFDTQIAAGFLGLGNPSLGMLYEHVLGIQIAKADRLSDWLARPLTRSQLDYAASDVEHLLEVYRRQHEELDSLGRLAWVDDECEIQIRRAIDGRNPDDAWLKIKEARQLKGHARAVAKAVARWREQRAATVDQPIRHVIADMTVIGIAQRPPKTIEDLTKVRGLDSRYHRGRLADELLEVVAGAEPVEDAGRNSRSQPLEARYRPVVPLISAWVSQQSHQLRIDASLLATRADIEGFLKGDPSSRLNDGWRADLLTDPIKRIISGDVALAFSEEGELLLEERSNIPI